MGSLATYSLCPDGGCSEIRGVDHNRSLLADRAECATARCVAASFPLQAQPKSLRQHRKLEKTNDRMWLTLSESPEKLDNPAVDGIKTLRVELLCSCCALVEQARGVEPDERMVS